MRSRIFEQPRVTPGTLRSAAGAQDRNTALEETAVIVEGLADNEDTKAAKAALAKAASAIRAAKTP